MTNHKASYDDVEMAFLAVNGETEAWLDRVTGEVILITDDTRSMFDSDLDTLPDWAREEVIRARRVLRAVGDWDDDDLGDDDPNDNDDDDASDDPDAANRYVAIPETPSHEAFQDMADFVATLPNSHAAVALTQALRGGKPFRRFKDTLRNYPAEQERWYAFQNQRLRDRITEWANDEGITLS